MASQIPCSTMTAQAPWSALEVSPIFQSCTCLQGTGGIGTARDTGEVMLGSLCHQSSHDTHYHLVIDHQTCQHSSTPHICTLSPRPVYRSHTWTKPDPLCLPLCFPYLRRSWFSTAPAIPCFLQESKGLLPQAKPLDLISLCITSWFSPPSPLINTLVWPLTYVSWQYMYKKRL